MVAVPRSMDRHSSWPHGHHAHSGYYVAAWLLLALAVWQLALPSLLSSIPAILVALCALAAHAALAVSIPGVHCAEGPPTAPAAGRPGSKHCHRAALAACHILRQPYRTPLLLGNGHANTIMGILRRLPSLSSEPLTEIITLRDSSELALVYYPCPAGLVRRGTVLLLPGLASTRPTWWPNRTAAVPLSQQAPSGHHPPSSSNYVLYCAREVLASGFNVYISNARGLHPDTSLGAPKACLFACIAVRLLAWGHIQPSAHAPFSACWTGDLEPSPGQGRTISLPCCHWHEVGFLRPVALSPVPTVPCRPHWPSLGGNILVKFLGERGKAGLAKACPFDCAVSMCNPLDFPYVAGHNSRLINRRLYQKDLSRGLLAYMRRHVEVLRSTSLLEAGQLELLVSSRQVSEYDRHVICPLYGYCDPSEYYEKASSLAYLPVVPVPTLCL
eukprot:gene10364-1878_t